MTHSMPTPQDDYNHPAHIHGAEQMWAQASAYLDVIIKQVRMREPMIYGAVENTDSSVLYEWLKCFILGAEAGGGDNPTPHEVTILMCAAAITKLVRAPRTTDDTLAQLDKELDT